MSTKRSKRVQLNKRGLFVGRAGIDSAALVVFLAIAAIALFVEDSLWVSAIALALIPTVLLLSWMWILSGLEVAPADSSPLTRKPSIVDRYSPLYLNRQINAAGGVPNDIGLDARLDCLIRQRDGEINVLPNHGMLQPTMVELGRAEGLICDLCDREADWVRRTQFGGDHPFCDPHARAETDFAFTGSGAVWESLGTTAAR